MKKVFEVTWENDAKNSGLASDIAAKCLEIDLHNAINGTFSVKEITPFELPKTRTGILKPSAFDDKSICSIDFTVSSGARYNLKHDNQSIGKRLNISENVFPDSFYVDIQEEIDYSKIPVGAVVEINKSFVGYFFKFDERNNSISIKYSISDVTFTGNIAKNNIWFFVRNIKSIEILKMPEVTNGN